MSLPHRKRGILAVNANRMFLSLIGIASAVVIAGCSQESAAASDQDAWVGSTLKERKLTRSEACIGFFDGFLKRDKGWTAAGWAWNTEKAEVPGRVLLVDAEDEIIGVADTIVDRPGLSEKMTEVKTDKAGWVSQLAEAEDVKNPVSAYAMLDDTTVCALKGQHELR